MMDKPFYVAVDFDGTMVEYQFPGVGPPVPGAVEWMREWLEAGASLILWTMRSDDYARGRMVLTDAVEWCQAHGIALFGVNVNPTQGKWTQSPKVYAHVYVDDTALGCPLVGSSEMGRKPMVDWGVVGPWVLAKINAHFAN